MSLAARNIRDPNWRNAIAVLADPAPDFRAIDEALSKIGDLSQAHINDLVEHRLMAALGCYLENANPAAEINSTYRDQAAQSFRTGRVRALLVERDLKNLAAAAVSGGIKLIAPRGFALTHRLYRDPGARISGDIDLAVVAADREKIFGMASMAGYEVRLTNADAPEYEEICLYIAKGRGHRVEVHIFSEDGSRYPLPVRDIFDNAVESDKFPGLFFPMPEHAVLLTIEHIARHRLGYFFQWISELHRLILEVEHPEECAGSLTSAGLSVAAHILLDDLNLLYYNEKAQRIVKALSLSDFRIMATEAILSRLGPGAGGNAGASKLWRHILTVGLIDQPLKRIGTLSRLMKSAWFR